MIPNAVDFAKTCGFPVHTDDLTALAQFTRRVHGNGFAEGFSHSSQLWGFFHTTCIYESAAALVSLHRSKETAWRAMRKAQWDAWIEIQQGQRFPRKRVSMDLESNRGQKAYIHQRSHIAPIEVHP